MSHPILCLDFDGVLHGAWEQDHLFDRVPLLEEWIQARPDLRVVVSSSWRLHHPEDELRGYLGPVLAQRMIGVTPHVSKLDLALYPDRLHLYERELEITAWLRAHTDPWVKWAALDDVPGLFSPGCKGLVVCNRKVGLMPLQLEQLDAVLNRGA
jgi:hypothetical protein